VVLKIPVSPVSLGGLRLWLYLINALKETSSRGWVVVPKNLNEKRKKWTKIIKTNYKPMKMPHEY
jgi:hypothetical protein